MQCARCGAGPAGADQFDWCGLCGQKLCDECMAAGCCGQSPAISGRTQDGSGAGPTGWDEPDEPDQPIDRQE